MRSAFVLLGIMLLVGAGIFYLYGEGKSSLPRGPEGTMKETLTLSSPAFKEGESIPSQFTCDGDNVSPPLTISGVPEGTASLVLIMDDPDVPKALKPDGVFDHWVMYGIPPETQDIPEGALSGSAGLNGAGEPKYAGPCPPPQYEPREHRYFFRLYALKGSLDFIKAPTKSEVLSAIQSDIIAQAELMGRYKRTR
jgi:Raf kinase inhibitor-like YbhB/YbcL family protein